MSERFIESSLLEKVPFQRYLATMILATLDWWNPVFSLIQTLTILVTAGFAIRYTRETIEMRKAAEKQAVAANEQLSIARTAAKEIEQEKIRESLPFFVFHPITAGISELGGGVPKRWQIPLKIEVAAVFALHVRCHNPNVTASFVNDRPFWDIGTETYLDFQGKDGQSLPEEWEFTF